MKKLYRLLKRLFITLLLLLLLVAVALAVLLFTTPALKVAKVIANHFLQPVGISLKGEISGQINDLYLSELTIKEDTVDIRLNDIQLSWSLWSLISKQILDVQKLSLSKVYVDVNTEEDDDSHTPTSDDAELPFSMPVDLYVNNLYVASVHYFMNQKAIITTQDFSAKSVSLVNDKLTLSTINTRVPDYSAKLQLSSGYIILNAPFTTQLKLTLKMQQNGIHLDSVQTQISGDFARVFSIGSSGMVRYDHESYPYHLVSTFDQGAILSKLELEKVAAIDNRLVFSNQLDWSVTFKSLNPLIPIHFNAGGFVKNTDQNMVVKTNFCDAFSDKIALRCEFNLQTQDQALVLKRFRLFNPNNDDHILLSMSKKKDAIRAKWEAFVLNLSHYPLNARGRLYSNGTVEINGQTAKQLQLTLGVSNFLYRKLDIPQLSLNANTQQLLLNADSTKASIALKATLQKVSLSTFSAKLQQLMITNKAFNQHWQLTHDVDVLLSPDQNKLDQLCLRASDSNHFCINADISPYLINLETSGQITPATFIVHLPYGGDSFVLSFDAFYQQSTNADPKAEINILGHGFFFASNTSWFKQLQQIAPLHELAYTTELKTRLQLNNQKLLVTGNVAFPQNQLKLAMKSDPFALDDLAKATLQGSIDAHSTRLDWVSNFFPQFPTLVKQGVLNGHLAISGKWFDPCANGDISLHNAEVELLPFNISLENINGDIHITNPLNAKINLNADIQKSPLNLTGFSDLHGDTPLTQIDITGKQLLVLNTPDIEVTVTPALTFSQEQGNSSLSGNIFMDKLIVNLAGMKNSSLQNTIQNDVIYVNNSNQTVDAQKTTPFSMNLHIDMGKHAHISGLGIDTKIQGNLNIISQPNQPMLGVGTLQPIDGVFSAYGKHFTVDPKSKILFNNSAVGNPQLAITTYYSIPTSVKLTQSNAPESIGIEITGTANNPKLQLFSNPNMSQTDILSYILFGQVFTNANSSQASSDALSQAALLIAINEGGSSMINELKDRLSLAEFSLGSLNNNPTNTTNSTTAEQNNTAVFIGKQVTPRLYLSYGVGVFTGEQQGIATFSLTPKWKLKGEATSFDRGGDILYQTHSGD
ncbi:translocation/assembly module TamB domain-containing protein [Caedibacter taeniospiralis]|uniref:translocation/assembly module TamB domain-containing protein n=1 Tax=Caedibacter taeniospiralis TaxID=28907 RepID=UPI0037BF5456